DRRRLDAEPEEPPEGVAGAGEPQRRARRLALDEVHELAAERQLEAPAVGLDADDALDAAAVAPLEREQAPAQVERVAAARPGQVAAAPAAELAHRRLERAPGLGEAIAAARRRLDDLAGSEIAEARREEVGGDAGEPVEEVAEPTRADEEVPHDEER